MERKLKRLFDYQKFEGNADLQQVIDSVHARYAARELNFDEMEFVVAGPGAKSGIKKCFKNASAYFEKSLSIKTDYLTIYNYMITLIKFNKLAEAKERYNQLIKMSMNSDISNTDKSFIKEDLQKIQNILN